MTHFNRGSKVATIPAEWQQSTYDGDAEAVVEIQKQNKAGRYEKLQLQDIDVDYMVGDRKLTSLKPGDKSKQELDFGMLYDLTVAGNYKVRVCIPMQKFNADCCSNYSSWMYFRISDNCR
ncbi:hypothetical protein [Desertivirga arenae]|uniref:hypothetical protein n=1 Tax=Desertivirga arenae TaxID=2810309 RepID=UPI001A9662F9|nr:hypothetical protein [Pedobacter sp. SYSU D00823]